MPEIYTSRHTPGNRPEPTEQETKFSILRNPGERIMVELGLARLVQAVERKHYDTLFFLDKSARPFAWGFKRLWENVYPQRAAPQIKFINPPVNKDSHVDHYKKEFSQLFREPLGQKICLVDERAFTGQSFKFVEDLLGTEDSTAMRHIDRFEAMSIWPSWYNQPGDAGVVEKSDNPSFEELDASANRRAAYQHSLLLVSPVRNKTQRHQQLRNEINRLAQRAADAYEVLKNMLGQKPLTRAERDDLLENLLLCGIDDSHMTAYEEAGQPAISIALTALRQAKLPSDPYILTLLFDQIQNHGIVVYNDTQRERPAMEQGLVDFRDNTALNAIAARLEAVLYNQHHRKSTAGARSA